MDSILPIVRIDGSRIKKIRDAKGLTQLYLSEVVGVTTDTISRWENRRYPSIKLENARKLAQALEVDLEEILEKEEDTPTAPPQDPLAHTENIIPPKSRLLKIGLPLFLVIAALGGYFYFSLSQGNKPPVSATRILPPHIPPGQIFPVLIRVLNPTDASIALIVKESVPPGTIVLSGIPPFTTFDNRGNELKWISRTASRQTVFAYSVQSPEDVTTGQLEFNGSVTLKQASGSDNIIHGAAKVTVSPYHWADTNKDLIIDDEEILAVYDMYSEIEGLDFDRDLIDDIWAGSGYRWDKKTGQYIVLE